MIDPKQGETDWKLIEALNRCPGWTEWLVPKMEKRLEEIKTLLLNDGTEQETDRLRTEHRVIRGWIQKPEQVRGVLEARAKA